MEGRGEVTIRDLVRNSLRMRPDRIIVGEVRGPETLDMLQAMNTGHDGSLSTVHANSPRDALARLETMVLMAGIELPSRAIREQIASALHLIVHLQRFRDGSRRVTHVTEVGGMEGDIITLSDIYAFDYGGGCRRRRALPRHGSPHGHQAVVLGAPDRPRAEPAGGDVRRDRPLRREPAVSAVRKLLAGAASVVDGRRRRLRPGRSGERRRDRDHRRRRRGLPDGLGRRRHATGPSRDTADTFEVLGGGVAGRGVRRAHPHRRSRGDAAPRHVGEHGRRPAREREGGGERVPVAAAPRGQGRAWSPTGRPRRWSPRHRPIGTAVTAGIAPLTADTDTALYDAVIFAAGQFTPDAERRAIVLLSDGEDNVSVASLEAATAAAAEMPVHVIELVTDRSDRPALDQLAAAGGGTVSSATDPTALSELYRQAAGTLANQYRITLHEHAGPGPVELTVRVNTGEGVLADTTTVELPAAAPVPTAAPHHDHARRRRPHHRRPCRRRRRRRRPRRRPSPPTPTPGEPEGSNLGLLVGAGAFFVALLLDRRGVPPR